jgi:hypothetical protein
MEQNLSMANLLAAGSDASVSEEPPPELAADVKGPSHRSRARPASPAAPRRRRSPAAKVERVDTSGAPCSLCGKPGHLGGHCPSRGVERLENDRRVLEERAAAARAARAHAPPTAVKQEGLPVGEKDKKARSPLAAGDAARGRERERPRSRDRDRSRERKAPRSHDRYRDRDREGEKPRSRGRERARSREGERSRSRERERAHDKLAAAKKHRSRERDEKRRRSRSRSRSRERDEKRRRSRSRSRSRGRAATEPRRAAPPAAEPAAAPPPVEENKHALKSGKVTLETVLAEAKRLKRAADAVTTHDAPKEMLRAVLQYLEAATMQESQVRASASDAASETLAVLLTQTSALCDFASVRAEELLRGEQDQKTTVELRLVSMLALRLCICCIAQAASFRRAALRAEAEAAASASEASLAAQKRMAGAVLEAIKLSDLWERSGAAAIAASAVANVNRHCTEALTSCQTVGGAAGGYGGLRQIRFNAKHALGKIDSLWAEEGKRGNRVL